MRGLTPCRLSVVVLAVAVAVSSDAASLIWTNGDGNFSDGSKWSTGVAPVAGDDVSFTNDTSYTVTFTGSTPTLRTNTFAARAGAVTLNLNGATWSVSDMFSVGSSGHATAVVYVAGGAISSSGALRVGDSDISVGQLVVTNGTLNAATITVGATFGSSGTLIASGASVGVNSSSILIVGNNGAANCNLTVNNGAQINSPFVFIGNSGGTSSNAVNLGGVGAATTANLGSLTFGGFGASFGNTMSITNATLTINNGTIGDGGSSFNTMTILSGATVMDSSSFRVGNSTTGNVLVVNGGVLTNNPNLFTLRLGVTLGFGNSVIVSNGGKIFFGKIIVGDGNNFTGGSNNTLQVGGYGLPSLVSVSGGNQVVIGQGGANGQSLIITNGTLFNNGGPYIGSGTSNNTCTILAGGVFDVGNTAIQVGYTGGGAFQTAGNVLTVGSGGLITNGNGIAINPNNSMVLHGGTVAMIAGTRSISVGGTLSGVGTLSPGSLSVLSGGTFAPGDPVGAFFIDRDFTNVSGSTLEFHLGTSSSLVVVGTNVTLDGTLNVTDSGGLVNGTYTLFTYGGTGTINPGFAIGSLPGTFSGTVSNDTANKRIVLVLSGGPSGGDPFATWQFQYFGSTNCATCGPNADFDGDGLSNTNEFTAGFDPTNNAAYLHVISVDKVGNDLRVTYLGANGNPPIASRTNVLEYTTGTATGGYTNNFISTGQTNVLSGGNGSGVVTNMVDPGGATNSPARYYRVRVLVP